MAQRVKGQDVAISVAIDGVPTTFVTDVRNFELTPKFTKLEEQYLGQTTKMYDEIFDGADFKMEMHFEDAGVLNFVKAVKERAQKQTPGVKFNISATLNFVGTRARVYLTDCYFENLPIEFGSRSEYGQFTISGSCSDITHN